MDYTGIVDYVMKAGNNRNPAILTSLLNGEPGMKELPDIGPDDKGKILHVNLESGALEWFAIIKELPDVNNTDKNKILHTNASTGEVEWINAPTGLPTVGSSNKDKWLHTNASTGVAEWLTLPTELPTVTAEDNGSFLTVKNGVWNKGNVSPLVITATKNSEIWTLDKTYDEIYHAVFSAGALVRWNTPTGSGTLNNVPCRVLWVGKDSSQVRSVYLITPDGAKTMTADADDAYPTVAA